MPRKKRSSKSASMLLARRMSIKNTYSWVFLAVFAVLAGFVVYTGYASTPEVASGRTGYCLDDHGNGTGNGNLVDIWSCNGSAAQHWTMSGQNVEVDGKCLDAKGYGTANGTTVDLWACNGGSNQHWYYKGSGQRTVLVNVHANKCLDDTAWGGNGTGMELYTCNGQDNQIWYASSYGASTGGTGSCSNYQSICAAQADAHTQLAKYGWDNQAQYACLDDIYTEESGWRWNAQNPTSPAYGIPQADPGSKMASAGSDWRTNPNTQIKWGVGYIKAVYGTPCAAWAFHVVNGYY
jgi:hypothetical protein